MTTRVISLVRVRLFEPLPSSELRLVLLTIAIAIAVIVPALVFGIPANKDLNNHFRFALPFYDAIRNGNLFPSWLAESTGGYGDPSFRFYPPGLYYLLALTRSISGNWYGATLLAFTSLSIASGLGTYLWAKSILPSRAAMWAAAFYLLAPYHVNDLYQATLLAEYAAGAVLPFAFWSIENVCTTGSRRSIAGLAAAYCVLLLTHLPMAVIGSIGLCVYAVARVDFSNWRTVMKLAGGALLGLAASAFYWVTMVSELKWISTNNVVRDASVDYRLNFLFSTLSLDNLNVWWMNILTVASLVLFVPALILFKRRQPTSAKMRPVIVLMAFSFFMATPLSRPLWYLLTPLQQVQFPWRWLGLFSLLGSVVVGSALIFWRDPRTKAARALRALAFGAVAISIAFTVSHIIREAQYLSSQQFEATLTAVRGTPSVNYWIPIWSTRSPRPMTESVEADGRYVSIESWGPEDRKFSIAAGAATTARVRTFYYPHWRATTKGHALSTWPDKDGALLIAIPAETTSVDLQFREPRRTQISGGASVLGLLVIVALASPVVRRQKLCKP